MFFKKKSTFSLPITAAEDQPVDFLFSSEKFTSDNDGQLAVDVVESETEIVVLATMAGTPKEKVQLNLDNDLLTIKGERQFPFSENSHFHFRECYWGRFSRAIVLPADVLLDLVKAEYRNGLLIVHLPKTKKDQNIPIFVIDD
jgi:HSP20 family protein